MATVGSVRQQERSGVTLSASLARNLAAQPARKVTYCTDWKYQIIFAKNFEPAEARNVGLHWDVPAVVLISPDDPVADRFEIVVPRQIRHVVLRSGSKAAASAPDRTRAKLSTSWPSTSIDRKSKPSGAPDSSRIWSRVHIGTSMTASGTALGAMPERSSDDKGPATCER
jgi:hypothetical protein